MNPEDNNKNLLRRRFLARLSLALGGMTAMVVSVPVMASLVGPWLRKVPRVWRNVGLADAFQTGETVLVEFEDASPLPWAGTTARTGAWLRKLSDTTFIAFSLNCSHLGCPVRWIAASELFLCPCHGGVYYKDGSRASGPPPKGLAQYPVRVRNGVVEIETSPVSITTV